MREEKIEPPVRAPLYDAARGVQLVGSKSAEWNLRKDRVAFAGFPPEPARRCRSPYIQIWRIPTTQTLCF